MEGRVAVITGGTRGIGRALTERLLREGWKVATVGIDKAAIGELRTVFEDFPFYAKSLSVENIKEMEVFIEETEQKLGPIHALINNAAILGPLGCIGEVNRGSIKKAVAVNLTAVIELTSFVIEKMSSRAAKGIILNLSSQSSKGVPGIAVYSATKAAINTFSMSIAEEYQRIGIYIFALNPGRVLTNLFEEISSIDPKKLPYVNELLQAKREGFLLTPEESAMQIHYLLEHPEDFETTRMLDYVEIKDRIENLLTWK